MWRSDDPFGAPRIRTSRPATLPPCRSPAGEPFHPVGHLGVVMTLWFGSRGLLAFGHLRSGLGREALLRVLVALAALGVATHAFAQVPSIALTIQNQPDANGDIVVVLGDTVDVDFTVTESSPAQSNKKDRIRLVRTADDVVIDSVKRGDVLTGTRSLNLQGAIALGTLRVEYWSFTTDSVWAVAPDSVTVAADLGGAELIARVSTLEALLASLQQLVDDNAIALYAYCDLGDLQTLEAARQLVDDASAATLAQAESYADAGDADTRDYCDVADEAILAQAEDYTDLSLGPLAQDVADIQADYLTSASLYGADLQQLADLQSFVTADTVAHTVEVSDANLRVVNGLGSTFSANGLGNLIVGYDEDGGKAADGTPGGGDSKTGSHNVVIGPWHSYPSFGGLVGGLDNAITGAHATATGEGSIASGYMSTVTGGLDSTASGPYASVVGGSGNTASGNFSTVTGGLENEASGFVSSVSGGWDNEASGFAASVTAGWFNLASGPLASVTGGKEGTASGEGSSVTGGGQGMAIGDVSVVAGGSGNHAEGGASLAAGGNANTASGGQSTVVGGNANGASTTYATVSGGELNNASGFASSVAGGYGNEALGFHASVAGGVSNTADGDSSTVSGGNGNTAAGYATSEPVDSVAAEASANGLAIGGMQTQLGSFDAQQVADLQSVLSVDTVAREATFTGVNVQVLSGGGSTDAPVNGLGNLIVGYDEDSGGQAKLGSHNLVLGKFNAYEGVGGIVGGTHNTITGDYSAVITGDHSAASGHRSAVLTGEYNTVGGAFSAIVSGDYNEATGDWSGILGGWGNTTLGWDSTVSGGTGNTTSEYGATVAGGQGNTASGFYSTVAGGLQNTASGSWGAVLGGEANQAIGFGATIAGGHSNTADNYYTTALGGRPTWSVAIPRTASTTRSPWGAPRITSRAPGRRARRVLWDALDRQRVDRRGLPAERRPSGLCHRDLRRRSHRRARPVERRHSAPGPVPGRRRRDGLRVLPRRQRLRAVGQRLGGRRGHPHGTRQPDRRLRQRRGCTRSHRQPQPGRRRGERVDEPRRVRRGQRQHRQRRVRLGVRGRRQHRERRSRVGLGRIPRLRRRRLRLGVGRVLQLRRR